VKRFYKQATVGERGDEGWPVLLDGRPVRTPEKRPLAVPSDRLAAAIAQEWADQGDTIQPFGMHLTRTANAAIDRVAPNRALVEDELVGFGETDTLCYRVDGPPELAERQRRTWQPLLDWATGRFDCALAVTTGILPAPQDAAALAALRSALAPHDPFGLAGLHGIAAATHSLVLALAVADGHLDAAQAIDAALLDETYQNEHWGEDSEAAARRETTRVEVDAAARLLDLLRPSD